MAFSLKNWRQDLGDFWPRLTRLERLTVYFAGIDLFLFVAWKIGGLFGADSSLGGWFTFVGYLTAFLALLVGARYVRRVLMWRLRNRLIVTYVFIGVIPVVLLVLIGFISAYLFGWQFATYIATSDIDKEISTLSALNHRAATQIAAGISRGTPLSPELVAVNAAPTPEGSQAEMTAWYAGKAVAPPRQQPAAPPPEKAPEARGLVLDGHRLLFRVSETIPAGKDKLTVISSVPLDDKMLEHIGTGLGEVSLALFSTRSAADQKDNQGGIHVSTSRKSESKLTVGNEDLDLKATNSETPTLRAGKLPPPTRTLDRMITGGTIVTVLDWRTGQIRSALLGVLTRPSLLYGRLFVTVGQSTNFIVGVLVVVAIFFAVIELLALFIGLRLTRTMTRSIAELYVATEHVNQGDLSHRIEVKREDQLGALERSFNSMTTSLERLLDEQKEKQRLENELAIAQEVQAQLFPTHTHEVPGLELYGICRPARTVSGDYYDFLPFEAGKVAVAAGDVSGKGISAALLMATIHSAVRAFSLEASVTPAMAGAAVGGYSGSSLAYSNGDLSPARLMSLLNSQLYRSTPTEKYATLVLCTYSSHTQILNYCNAGHLPPVVLSPDGSSRRLDAGGTVVGLFPDVTYDEGAIRLSRGEIVVAYSDGLTEPENDFGEFGEERLIDLVRENRDKPLERIADIVIAAVLDWIGGGEQPDDMTLVLARPI
jgi:sigma-B regulation protein RsbU (phosphoserine phosphatase)